MATQAVGYKLGFCKQYIWLTVTLLVLAGVIGIYLLTLLSLPNKPILTKTQQNVFLQSQSFIDDRLIIPKISLNQPIITGDASVLEKGIWHRFPERGNPIKGGNMILAGHRYVFSWLPHKTVEKSRLYNLDKLEVGDEIYINWQNSQYRYIIVEKMTVRPDEIAIESESTEPRLTLYTCTLDGESDGRVVVTARQMIN